MNRCGLCGIVTMTKEDMIKHYDEGECCYNEEPDKCSHWEAPTCGCYPELEKCKKEDSND